MRAVNLIPVDERRDGHAPLRSGALPYVVIATLVVILAGVAALVLTGNEISGREADLAGLQSEGAAAARRAAELAPYARFRSLGEARAATVAELADSRFDWERVMRELSLVLPHDAWLVSLDASASAGSGGGGGGGSGLRAGVAGPALELSGCAAGQEAVARFVTALKGIDGVTRVGVQSSQLSGHEGGGGGGDSGGSDCRTREFIAKFEIVVAFDAAPVPAVAGGEATVATGGTEGATAPAADEAEEGG